VTVQGTGVTLGGDVLIGGGGNWTNSAGSVISPTNVTISGGTFNANDSTTNMSGNFTFGPTPGNEAAFPGTFNSGTGTFNFNGSGAQSISGPGSPTVNNRIYFSYYSGGFRVLEIQNENLVALEGERALAMVPDIITVLDSQSANAISTERLRYGQRVTVIAFPCDPIWRTARGLELAGPRHFGYDLDYAPVEDLHALA
jgi:hypothetical protein